MSTYNFEDLSTDVFMDVLAKYQYDTGGFGGLVYEYEYNGPTLHDTNTRYEISFPQRKTVSRVSGYSKDDEIYFRKIHSRTWLLG